MIEPKPQASPYDSCHHKDTSLGDTFGGLGTDKEYREELVRARSQRHSDGFPNSGTASASANPRSRDTYDYWARRLAELPPDCGPFAHESTHDKP